MSAKPGTKIDMNCSGKSRNLDAVLLYTPYKRMLTDLQYIDDEFYRKTGRPGSAAHALLLQGLTKEEVNLKLGYEAYPTETEGGGTFVEQSRVPILGDENITKKRSRLPQVQKEQDHVRSGAGRIREPRIGHQVRGDQRAFPQIGMQFPDGMDQEHVRFIMWYYTLTFLHPDQITRLLNNFFKSDFTSLEVIAFIEQFPQDPYELDDFPLRLKVPSVSEGWMDPVDLGVDISWLRTEQDIGQSGVSPKIFRGVEDVASNEWRRFYGLLRDTSVCWRRSEIETPAPFTAPLVHGITKPLHSSRHAFRLTFFGITAAIILLDYIVVKFSYVAPEDWATVIAIPILPLLYLTLLYRSYIEPLFMKHQKIKRVVVTERMSKPSLALEQYGLRSYPFFDSVVMAICQAFILTCIIFLLRPALRQLRSRLGLISCPRFRDLSPSQQRMALSKMNAAVISDTRNWSSDPVPSRLNSRRTSMQNLMQVTAEMYGRLLGVVALSVDAIISFIAFLVLWGSVESMHRALTGNLQH